MKNIISILAFVSFSIVSSICVAEDGLVKPKINFRAFQCQKIDYAELNSMDEDELLSVFCGYSAAITLSSNRFEAAKIKYANSPSILTKVIEDRLHEIDICSEPLAQVIDIFSRKYPKHIHNCPKTN